MALFTTGARLFSLGLLIAAVGCSRTPSQAAYGGVRDGVPTGSASISTNGLVAAYDMSTLTADGFLRDFGPHGLHGTLSSSSQLSSPLGGALDFSDVGFRVDLPEGTAFDIDGPLTVAAWVRVDEGALHQHIVACDDKWALWITPDNRYRLGDTRGGGWSTTASSVQLGAWTALVAVLSATRGQELTDQVASIYLNGALVSAERHMRSTEAAARSTWEPGDLYTQDACYLGFESHQGDEAHQRMPFAGAIDEIIIAARAWSVEEVVAFSTLQP